jgi:hypothetical protein
LQTAPQSVLRLCSANLSIAANRLKPSALFDLPVKDGTV